VETNGLVSGLTDCWDGLVDGLGLFDDIWLWVSELGRTVVFIGVETGGLEVGLTDCFTGLVEGAGLTDDTGLWTLELGGKDLLTEVEKISPGVVDGFNDKYVLCFWLVIMVDIGSDTNSGLTVVRTVLGRTVL